MGPNIYNWCELEKIIDVGELIDCIEEGFKLYSEQKTVIPPVGYLSFQEVNADVHIKYGYILNDDYYVVKLASGFYDNSAIGLPSGNGLMLIFSQKNGQLLAILLDEGNLTDIRTGVAGAISAKYLAPRHVNRIGVLGTGRQARTQLTALQHVCPCNNVTIWGRDLNKLAKIHADLEPLGFEVFTTTNIRDITTQCNLIITTTPSRQPLISATSVLPGTHITALGANGEGKRELDPKILQKAHVVVADSIGQCFDHGEIHYAANQNLVRENQVLELGQIISDPSLGRNNSDQITVADLTGVAVQDIQIAKYAYQQLLKKN